MTWEFSRLTDYGDKIGSFICILFCGVDRHLFKLGIDLIGVEAAQTEQFV